MLNSFQETKRHLEHFGEQLSGNDIALLYSSAARKKKYDRIIVCGMGGSGITGDIVAALSEELRIPVPVFTHKMYGLPAHAKNACVLFVSFSGDTEETLSGFAAAQKLLPKGSYGVATTGGKLLALARKNGVPTAVIPAGSLTPREAVGYNAKALYILLPLFFSGISTTPRLSRLVSAKTFERQGKVIGKKLVGKSVLVYTNTTHRVIGTLWKMYLNETGKIPAFANVLPEADHNEIQSFEKNRLPFTALFLESEGESARMAKRTRITKELLKRSEVTVLGVPLRGKSPSEILWNAALRGSWTALAVAEIKKMNPQETRIIRELKKRLGQ